MLAVNQIHLDENTSGKGRYFRSRFLQAGLVKYSFGVCVLEKQIIDKFIQGFVGCPVIIDHKEVTNENAKEERVGAISRVWFDESDGWFWGEGVIFDEKAISLINDGYNVSCQYEITEYAENRAKELHNGNSFDKTILNGKPEHLAIVKNPRYESAMIAVNALEVMNYNENHGKDGKFISGYSFKDEVTEMGENKINLYNNKNQEVGYLSYTDDEDEVNIDYMKKYDEFKDVEKGVAKKLVTQLMEKYPNKNIVWDCVSEESENARKGFIEKYPELGKKITGLWYEEVKKQYEQDETKNDIIQAINEIKETKMFKSLFKKEQKMDREELKEIFLECLTGFTASNEAKEEEKEEAENKCKNEEPDYKKMYEELKAKLEAKEAENKCKNEVEEEEKKEEVDEEAEKAEEVEKAKNCIEEQKQDLFKFEEVKSTSRYMTKEQGLKLGEELF